MKLKNKKVLVYGLGKSGRSAIKILRENGAFVSFYDDNIEFLEFVGFERNPFDKTYDFVVVSPGIKCIGNKLLENFEMRKIPVLSELDFGFLMCKGKVIAVTGTNGKTTVCSLTYEILKNSGYECFLCGNIGLPISSIAKETTRKSVIVCEVSNFQLETSRFFRANIACILNLKPDHLDRHGSFEEYRRVKARICQNMTFFDTLILNFDDKEAKSMIFHKRFEFFSKHAFEKDFHLKEGFVFDKKRKVVEVKKLKLMGNKNLENVLASLKICSHFKVKAETTQKVLENFVASPHRMEFVGCLRGVTYVDDSKATNVASALACLEAFEDKKIFLLLGGQGKDIEYDEIFRKFSNIKCVVCFGQEAKNIEECAKKFDFETTKFVSLIDATKFCLETAKSGDYVLLSPACSSFDEFSSYAERGEKFKEVVLEYVEK